MKLDEGGNWALALGDEDDVEEDRRGRGRACGPDGLTPALTAAGGKYLRREKKKKGSGISITGEESELTSKGKGKAPPVAKLVWAAS